MFIVYILQSQVSLRYYIGHTNNLTDRLLRHNSGGSRFTKNERPWVVIHQEQYQTRAEAIKREKEIKFYKGGNAFKKLIS